MLNSQLAIRQEIQRFESVHPSIYAIYDLIDLIPDAALSQSIRDHVVCIEGKSLCLSYYDLLIYHYYPRCERRVMKPSQNVNSMHHLILTIV